MLLKIKKQHFIHQCVTEQYQKSMPSIKKFPVYSEYIYLWYKCSVFYCHPVMKAGILFYKNSILTSVQTTHVVFLICSLCLASSVCYETLTMLPHSCVFFSREKHTKHTRRTQEAKLLKYFRKHLQIQTYVCFTVSGQLAMINLSTLFNSGRLT